MALSIIRTKRRLLSTRSKIGDSAFNSRFSSRDGKTRDTGWDGSGSSKIGLPPLHGNLIGASLFSRVAARSRKKKTVRGASDWRMQSIPTSFGGVRTGSPRQQRAPIDNRSTFLASSFGSKVYTGFENYIRSVLLPHFFGPVLNLTISPTPIDRAPC